MTPDAADTHDLHYLSISEVSALIRDRKLSPVELVRAHLDRIDALPIGIQIAAEHFGEPMIYRVASAYEDATGWSKRHPPL